MALETQERVFGFVLDSYQEFLAELAKESGIEILTREPLKKLVRKRNERMSNPDGEHLYDPDARMA